MTLVPRTRLAIGRARLGDMAGLLDQYDLTEEQMAAFNNAAMFPYSSGAAMVPMSSEGTIERNDNLGFRDYLVSKLSEQLGENRSAQRSANRLMQAGEMAVGPLGTANDLSSARSNFARGNPFEGSLDALVGLLGAVPLVGGAVRKMSRSVKTPLMMIHNQAQSSFPTTATLGGIPAPSAAITTPDVGLDHYGDVSLIFDPEVAKRMSGGPVYARDAYTPRAAYTWPSFSKDAKKAIYDIVGEQDTKFAGLLANDKEFVDDVVTAFTNKASRKSEQESLAALYGIDPAKVDDKYAENLRQQLFLDLEERGAPIKYKMRKETKYDIKDVDATTSKLMREMFREGIRGAENQFMSFGKALALVTPQLKTLKEVRDQAGRIKRLDSEKYAQATKQAEDLYDDIFKRVGDKFDGGFEMLSYALDDLFRYGKVRDKFVLDRTGGDDLSEFADDIAKFKSLANELPTQYLEKKFTKAVPYTAFKGAVIPEDAGPLVTKTLEDAGITNIVTYKNPEERAQAFKRFPELTFSVVGAGGVFLAREGDEERKQPTGGLLADNRI